MSWLRIALVGGLLSYRALFAWLRPGLFVATLLATPAMQISFFTLLGPYLTALPVEHFVIGNAIQACAVASTYGMSQMLERERVHQTLPWLVLTPAARPALYLGRMLPNVVNGLGVAAFGIVFGVLLLGARVPLEGVPRLTAALLAGALSCTALGVVVGAVGLAVRDTQSLTSVLYLLLLVTSGANVPVAALPAPLAWLSAVLPLRGSIVAARSAAGLAPADAWAPALGAELLIALVYAAVGYAGILAFERLSRATSALELY